MQKVPVVLNLKDRANWPADSDPVIVDRSTKWGNPFYIGHNRSRAQAIRDFDDYLVRSELMWDIWELVNRDLACWCSPLPCHAYVLLNRAYDYKLEDKGW